MASTYLAGSFPNHGSRRRSSRQRVRPTMPSCSRLWVRRCTTSIFASTTRPSSRGRFSPDGGGGAQRGAPAGPWYAFGSQGDAEVHIPVVDYIDRAFEWSEKYHMMVLLDLATVPGGQGDSNDPAAALQCSRGLAFVHERSAYCPEHARAPRCSLRLQRCSSGYRASGLAHHECAQEPFLCDRGYTQPLPAQFLPRMPMSSCGVHGSDKLVVFRPRATRMPGSILCGASSTTVCAWTFPLSLSRCKCSDITIPHGLSRAIARNRRLIDEGRHAGFPVIVGEWSGAAVFSNASVTPEGRAAYERVFIANQMASFAKARGWFFQTWKTERRIAAWDARVALGTLERAMLD